MKRTVFKLIYPLDICQKFQQGRIQGGRLGARPPPLSDLGGKRDKDQRKKEKEEYCL